MTLTTTGNFLETNMFHKFRQMKIYTKRENVYVLRTIFFLIASYFAFEIYSIYQNDFVMKNGNVFSKEDSPVVFWLGVFYHFSLMAANIYFISVFRVQKDDIEESAVVKKDDANGT